MQHNYFKTINNIWLVYKCNIWTLRGLAMEYYIRLSNYKLKQSAVSMDDIRFILQFLCKLYMDNIEMYM